MKYEDSHLSDEQLLLDIEGECPPRTDKLVRSHLDACWKCRGRRQDIESAIVDFARFHRREFNGKLPSAAGPRELLKAQLARLATTTAPNAPSRWFAWVLAAVTCGLAVLGLYVSRQSQLHSDVVVSIPDPRLTPGATTLATSQAVCSQANTNNKVVPIAIQRKVFEEYGISGDKPQAYEVDYLVTPALGGADDIRNLWPHSYSATVWNAQVKDALEVRLRDMVCNGNLELTEAQQEIARNWIAAYKKYFHTDKPLDEHSKRR